MEERNKTTAGLLALFLGAFGAHYFYLGNSKKGTTRLLLSIFVPLCAFIFGIIGIVDGIKMLTMSEEEFVERFDELRGEVAEEDEDYVVPARPASETKPDGKEPAEAPHTAKMGSRMPADYREKFDLLRTYKELLDAGAITEREFNVIKLRIMGWNV